MESRLTWRQRIRDALDRNRFVLYAQPILDLRGGEIVQYEVLLRLRDDTGELILPAVFLEVAEQFGLVNEIDRWVVGQAIRSMAAEMRAGRNLCLEVNLSGMNHGSFPSPCSGGCS